MIPWQRGAFSGAGNRIDVRIEDEELAKLVTVADIVSLLESKA